MIIDLTPETFFEHVHTIGPLHVVLHYGANCGPCKMTMPYYDAVAAHFELHKITNVKFYKFHHWETSYKEFIETNNLKTKGVPTFKHFYYGEVINELTQSFSDADLLKKTIMDTIKGIESTMGEFNLYAS